MEETPLKNLRLLVPPEEIRSIVERVAESIREDYSGRRPVLVGVLKGAFVFLADLVRTVGLPVEIDFIQTESYGRRDVPSREVLVTKDVSTEIRGRDVLVVEDIIDTGNTVRKIMEHLRAKDPASLKVCALLLRGTPRIKVDYPGKTIGGGFVVGYGLDYKENYRSLRGIYIIDTGKEP